MTVPLSILIIEADHWRDLTEAWFPFQPNARSKTHASQEK